MPLRMGELIGVDGPWGRLARVGRRGTGGRPSGVAVLVLVGAAASVGSLAGCGVVPGLVAPPCLPPDYSVSPAEATPGQAVTVSASDAGCDPRYGSGAQIEVILTDASGAEIVHDTAPMNDGGGFTYTFTVPSETAVGEASVTALPYNVDWCDDTGRNNRAAEPPAVTMERVSCAMPVKPLLITC